MALLLTPRLLVVARAAPAASVAFDCELARSSVFSPPGAMPTAAGGSRSTASTLRSTNGGDGGPAAWAFVAVGPGMEAAGALPLLPAFASTLEPTSVGLPRPPVASVLPPGSPVMSPTGRWRETKYADTATTAPTTTVAALTTLRRLLRTASVRAATERKSAKGSGLGAGALSSGATAGGASDFTGCRPVAIGPAAAALPVGSRATATRGSYAGLCASGSEGPL